MYTTNTNDSDDLKAIISSLSTSKKFSLCKIHQINNSKTNKLHRSLISVYYSEIVNMKSPNKSKLIGTLSLVKSMMMTCDLLVYFPSLMIHIFNLIHRKNELKFQKIPPNHLNRILSNRLRGDYKMKCIEIKNCRKTLDFSIASAIDYVQLNLINYERMMLNQKCEDMQSTSKFLAYLRHNVLQRGDYIT
jgi:hypothetical protein